MIVVASAAGAVAWIIAPRVSAIVKTAAALLMLSSLHIVFNEPIGFVVAARVKLASRSPVPAAVVRRRTGSLFRRASRLLSVI
jgi:hypothetical protein